MSTALYLEDLAVGQTFRSATLELDEQQIKDFANQFDPQPFHLDETAAAETLFHGLAASGWHTAALTMRLLVTSGLPIAGGIIGAGGEITWPEPVRAGDRLRLESEVIAIKPSASRPERGRVTVRTTTYNQHHRPVQVLVARLIVPARPRPG